MKHGLIIAIAGSVLLSAAAIAATEDPIETRQALMKDTREALKPLMGMTKGEIPFDADTVRESLATFAHTGREAGDLFPPGSESGHDTEAKSTIWTDREGFEKALDEFKSAVAEASTAGPHDADTLKGSLDSILGTCKGCHDDYRVDKD